MKRFARCFAGGAACAAILAIVAVPATWAADARAVDAPLAAPAPIFPQPVVRTLANGLRVAVFPDSRMPIVQVQLLVPAGVVAEPDSLPGLASLTAMLVDDGTSSRTAEQFATELASHAATFNATVTRDFALVVCGVRSGAFEPALELVSDAALNAVFSDESFTAARRSVAQQLGQMSQSVPSVADDRVWGAAFGRHPYGHSALGDIQSLLGAKREQVAAFYRARWRPDRAVLTISGDLSPERALAAAEEWFGRWSGKSAGERPGVPPTAGAPVQVVDLPGAAWSEVRLAWVGAGRASADALAWPIVATGLERSGLPAGAKVSTQTMRDATLLTIAFGAHPDSVATVTRRVRDAVRAYASHPPEGEALAGLRRGAAQGFPLSLESLGACASQWLALDAAGHGPDALARHYAQLVAGPDLTPALRALASAPITFAAGPGAELSKALAPLGEVHVTPFHRAPIARADTLPAATKEQSRRGQAAIAAAVLAHGGEGRLAAVRQLVSEGELLLQVRGQEFSGQFSQVRVDPDRLSFATQILGMQSRQVLVADSAWTLVTADSSSILEVDSLGVVGLKQTLNGDLVHLLREASRVDARPAKRGSEVVSGRTCDLVDFVAANGVRWRFAIDAVDHRVLAIDGSLDGDLRWRDRRVYSDFRSIEGLQLPLVEERFADGEFTSRFTTTLASTSRKIDPALFRKPRLVGGQLRPGN